MKKYFWSVILALTLVVPAGAQETDRQLLERIRAEIDAHLGGDVTPPPPTAGVTLERYEETNANGDSHKAHGRSEAPGTLLWPTLIVRDATGSPIGGLSGTWVVVEGGGRVAVAADPTTPTGAAMAQWWLGNSGPQVLRATYGGRTLEFVASVTGGPPPPVHPPPATSFDTPPAPGADANSWTGNTIPVRIIEGGSQFGQPVPITITANGESRTFHRSSTGASRTIHVPRGVNLTVTAHVTPTASAGLGGYGFTSLKMKAMDNRWGYTPDQVSHGNQAEWEPYTNNMAPGQPNSIPGWTWGGRLQTYCGSAPVGLTGPFWRYTIPDWVISRQGVDFLVVWILDHQYPRHVC